MITEWDAAGVQPLQSIAQKTKDFVTRLLPTSPLRSRLPRVQPSEVHPGFDNLGTAPPGPTTPTTNDLAVLYGGRNRLLTVRDAAEQLGVCAATVYRLCGNGELPHVRVSYSIRIRPADLDAYVRWARAPTALPQR